MDSKSLWNLFVRVFSKANGAPWEIIELAAIQPILLLSVQGYSNLKISHKFGITVTDVENILVMCLDFTGWESDLDFSPIAVYRNSNGLFDTYLNNVLMCSSMPTSDKVLNISFNICVKYNKIKNKLDLYGY